MSLQERAVRKSLIAQQQLCSFIDQDIAARTQAHQGRVR
jgi:hypothetical protein